MGKSWKCTECRKSIPFNAWLIHSHMQKHWKTKPQLSEPLEKSVISNNPVLFDTCGKSLKTARDLHVTSEKPFCENTVEKSDLISTCGTRVVENTIEKPPSIFMSTVNWDYCNQDESSAETNVFVMEEWHFAGSNLENLLTNQDLLRLELSGCDILQTSETDQNEQVSICRMENSWDMQLFNNELRHCDENNTLVAQPILHEQTQSCSPITNVQQSEQTPLHISTNEIETEELSCQNEGKKRIQVATPVKYEERGNKNPNYENPDKLLPLPKAHLCKEPFDCYWCRKKFFRMYQLFTHLRTHINEKPLNCGKCFREFNQASHCRKHERICRKILMKHPLKSVAHSSCSRTSMITDLAQNKTMNNNDKFLQQNINASTIPNCTNNGLSQKGTNSEMTYLSGCKSLPRCEVILLRCDTDITSNARISEDANPSLANSINNIRLNNPTMSIRKQRTEKNYDCVLCKKKFNRMDRLFIHCRAHIREKPFDCVTCDKTFSSPHYCWANVQSCHNHTRNQAPVSKNLINGSITKCEVKISRCDADAVKASNAKKQADNWVENAKRQKKRRMVFQFPCVFCSKVFKEVVALQLHSRQKHAMPYPQ